MSVRIGEKELRRRAFAGLRDEGEAFGSGHPDSRIVRREGLHAAIVPASPERSFLNSVVYEDPAAPAREYDSLAEAYDAAGIAAWTVWVPDEDRATAAMLAARGHEMDAAPRAMAIGFDGPPAELPAPPGLEPGEVPPAVAADLNDRAYGYGPGGFRAALVAETRIRWLGAYEGEVAVGCVGTIAIGDDCCITGVATPPEHQGRGIAGWLMTRAMRQAHAEGMASASLQASKAGAPVYERLGFLDLGFVEMWERRR